MSQTPFQDNSIFYFETIQSTQEKAKELLDLELFKSPAAIIAETQVGGKGREGRSWISPKGNLYLTFILPIPNEKISLSSNLSLILGTSVAETLEKEEIFLRLKWPNDLVFQGAKVGGILGEGVFKQKDHYLLLGLGLNVISSPSLERPTTALNSLRKNPLSLEIVTQNIIGNFLKEFEVWKKQGFFPFFSSFRSRLVHQENDLLTIGGKQARFIRPDPTGGILVEIEGKQMLLHSGEITAR